MPNNTLKTPPPTLTKKHLAKLQREQMWRRYLIIGTTIVLVLVVGILLYGIFLHSYIQGRQAVAIVDNEKITTSQWQDKTRFQRANLLNSAQRTFQFAQAFNDPSFQAQFASQLQQIKSQLDPNSLGKQVLTSMVDNIVIQKEAKKKNIQVSEQEIQQAYEGAFGYYTNGTPTPQPTLAPLSTSTLSALQLTLIPPTQTPMPTAVVTATEVIPTPTQTVIPTATSQPTATTQPTTTPDKLEGLDTYTQTVKDFKTNFGVNENNFRTTLRDLLKAQLFREKLQASVLAELNLSRTESQVWARHILVADEQQAKDVYDRLQKGENFCTLAAELSTDTSNKDSCGDLKWFGRGQMVPEFENAAFAMQPGEISQPVKTQFGYHIIQVLGNEERPITDSAYETLKTTKFQEWLDARKKEYKIEEFDKIWSARLITEPTWPATLDNFITQVQQQQAQPPIQDTPAP
jgi:parvulin-like peptidyl-prolyl isomerase